MPVNFRRLIIMNLIGLEFIQWSFQTWFLKLRGRVHGFCRFFLYLFNAMAKINYIICIFSLGRFGTSWETILTIILALSLCSNQTEKGWFRVAAGPRFLSVFPLYLLNYLSYKYFKVCFGNRRLSSISQLLCKKSVFVRLEGQKREKRWHLVLFLSWQYTHFV